MLDNLYPNAVGAYVPTPVYTYTPPNPRAEFIRNFCMQNARYYGLVADVIDAAKQIYDKSIEVK